MIRRHALSDVVFVWLVVAAACVGLGLPGCNRGPAVVQVSGKVLYKDGSVPKGGVRVVRFEPASSVEGANRNGASGSINADGTFVLCTRKPGDGVHCGEYKVTFAIMKGPRDQVSYVDEKYTLAATTPYQVTIDKDVDDLYYEIEPNAATNK